MAFLGLFLFGLPLFIMIGTVYLTALWPAVWINRRGYRWTAWLVALISVAAMATMPGVISRAMTWKDTREVIAKDVHGKLATPPRTIELELPLGRNVVYRDDPFLVTPCNAVCQKLLLSRQVDAVRVTDTDGRQAKIFRFEQRAVCPKAFAAGRQALPETVVAAAQGQCIVADDATSLAPQAMFRLSKRRWMQVQLQRGQARWEYGEEKVGEFVEYAFFVAQDAEWKLIARRTAVHTEAVSIPLILQPSFVGRGGFAREPFTLNAATDEDFLFNTAGYRAPTVSADMGSEQEVIDRLLNTQSDEPMGPELVSLLERYFGRFRAPFDVQQIAQLRAVLENKRIETARIAPVLWRDPLATAKMIEPILTRLKKPVDQRVGHGHNALVWALLKLHPEKLLPFKGEVFEIAELGSHEWPVAPILRVIGKLGSDPTDILRRRLASKNWGIRAEAAYGACSADEPWATLLVTDMVRAILPQYRGRNNIDSDLRTTILVMNRRGMKEEIASFLATLDSESTVARLRQMIAPDSKWVDACEVR